MVVRSIPPSPAEIVEATADHAFGSCQGVLIASWRGAVSTEAVRAMVRYRDERLVASDHFLGAIHIAEEGVGLPNAEARAAAQAGLRDRATRAPAVGMVVFGSGFAVSAVRSVATALFSLSLGPPTRFFPDIASCCAWIAERRPDSLDARSLMRACEQLRRAAP